VGAPNESDRPSFADEIELTLVPKAPKSPNFDAVPQGFSLRAPAPTGAGDTSVPPGASFPSTRPDRESAPGSRPRSSPRYRAYGRGLAMVLCVVFALIGAVPVLAGLLVRTDTVKSWAARETSALVERELGTRAEYRVEVKPWPLTLALEDVVVDGDDGKGPFLLVERASVRPRIFSLLAGKLDVGEIEVTGAKARVVVRNGELVSLRPKTPPSDPNAKGPDRLPFSALSVTDANVDLDVDGDLVAVREVDLDVGVGEDGAIELAARAGHGTITRKHEDPRHPGEDFVDEDRLCKLEARARVEPGAKTVLVRRVAVEGAVDFDPAPGTRPSCDLAEDDWHRLEVRLGAVRADLSPLPDAPPRVEGRVSLVAPAALAHRFVKLPHATGVVRLDADISQPLGESLPSAQGHLGLRSIGIDGKIFADSLDAELRFQDERLVVSNLVAVWGDGTFHIREASAGPLGPAMRLDVDDVVGENVDLQGLLRDLASTRNRTSAGTSQR
jgi:translocation and assembly module TamB